MDESDRNGMEPKPRSSVDALVEGLAQDGVHASRGEFTLDRKVAWEKLAKYRIAEPHTYVLELVQAAVLKGASFVDIRIDADDMHLAFDGRPFDRVDFDTLYEAALGAAGEPSNKQSDGGDETADWEARRQLAIALQGAQGIDPRFMCVRSCGPQGCVQLLIRPGHSDELGPVDPSQMPAPNDSVAADGDGGRTTVHVKSRLGLDLPVRVYQNVRGALPEELVLRERCRYARIPVSLDSERISQGWDCSDAVLTLPMGDAGMSGVVRLRPGLTTRRVRIVIHGVWITERELPVSKDEPAGLEVVIDSSVLRKDLSQREVVEDEGFKSVMALARSQMKLAARTAGLRYVTSSLTSKPSLIELDDEVGEVLCTAQCWDVWIQQVLSCTELRADPLGQMYLRSSAGQLYPLDESIWARAPAPAVPDKVPLDWFINADQPLLRSEHSVLLRQKESADQRLETEATSPPKTLQINALASISEGTLFGVGDHGEVFAYDGSRWSRHKSPVKAPLRATWGVPGGSVWAVGDKGKVIRWDGSGWKRMNTGHPEASWTGVWGSSESDVYVVGYHQLPCGPRTRYSYYLMIHYDGERWTTVTLPDYSEELAKNDKGSGGVDPCRLYAIWGSDSQNVCALGTYGIALRFDGNRWSLSLHASSKQWSPFHCRDVYDPDERRPSTWLHYNSQPWHPRLCWFEARRVDLNTLVGQAAERQRVCMVAGSQTEAQQAARRAWREGFEMCIRTSQPELELPTLRDALDREIPLFA